MRGNAHKIQKGKPPPRRKKNMWFCVEICSSSNLASVSDGCSQDECKTVVLNVRSPVYLPPGGPATLCSPRCPCAHHPRIPSALSPAQGLGLQWELAELLFATSHLDHRQTQMCTEPKNRQYRWVWELILISVGRRS